MARKQLVNDLSIDDLRYLIIEKKRRERHLRHTYYEQTGHVIPDPSFIKEEDRENQRMGDGDGLSLDDVSRARGGAAATPRKTFIDRLLLFIEVAAVAGLVVIFVLGVSRVQLINQEASALLVQPTLTPTPLIMAVVLPSGHTPPESPGGVRPNDAEIPEHLRPLVQSLPDLPVPTRGPQQAIRIQIPVINVDKPIIQGDGWEQLKKGVGQHIGTPNPGDRGNIVLSAHNDVFGEIFKELDQLNQGDQVIIYTSQRAYTYIVQQTQVVEPTQVEVMAPSQEPITTLISCYPYMVDNMRIVVTAKLQE